MLNILFVFVAIFFSGCQSSNFKINVLGQSDKVVVEHNFDISFLQKFQNITPGFLIASESFTKQDFVFFVVYEFRMGSGESFLDRENVVPSDFPYSFEFIVKMPGEIRKTNADKIKNGTAMWHISQGDKLEIWAKSIKVRYWIFPIIFLIVVIFLLRRKK